MKWIFEGRVYSSLEELKSKTMSEGNKPEPVFTLEEMKSIEGRFKSLFMKEISQIATFDELVEFKDINIIIENLSIIY